MYEEALQAAGPIVSAVDKATILFALSVSDDWQLGVEIHPVFWIGIIVILGVSIILGLQRLAFRSYEINEAEFGIGDQKIKIRPNTVDSQVAYRIWVELSTRKIGLPIDEEYDVISEVYDSWYGFFSVARGLIGDVPAAKLRRKDTEAIVKLSIKVLNVGLRPHLTKWQARYRKWFEREIEASQNSSKSPQEIQRQFPDYQILMTDLKQVNKQLISYRDHMYRLAVGH